MPRRPEAIRRDPVLLGCLAAVLAPFVVGLVRTLFVHWTPSGDWALLELRTRSVGGSHTPLIGAYSRFGWSHPGPALFYVLAVPYRLLGGRPSGMLVAALLVNAASVAGIVVVAWRRGGRPLVVGTAIAVALLCHALGASFLRDPWNPTITVLPLAALVFVAWSFACGDRWMLPVAILVASFLVQSHVGYAVLVATLLLFAIAWRVVSLVGARRVGGEKPSRRSSRALIGVTALAIVAAWLPPLIDQIVNPGNFNAILEFFGKPHATPSNDTAFRLVGRSLAFPGTWITGHDTVRTVDFTSAASGFFFPLALVALVVGAVFAARRRDRDALAFVGLVFVTFFAAAYSISRVAGPLAGYLVRWLLVLGMVSWLAAAWALWPALRRMRVGRGGRAVLVIVAGVALAFPTVASVVDAARSRGPWYRTGVVEAQLARDTVAHLHTDGRPVLLRSDHERWWTWGLAPRLEAAGIPVAARQQDVLYYGRHRVARFHEARVAVVVVVGADARTTGRPAGGRLLAFHQGAHLPALGYGATASQSEVLRAVERDFLDRTIAVYEVPL